MRFAHLTGLIALTFLSNDPAHVAGRQFVGSTPCDREPRLFLGISPTVQCERIDWKLELAKTEDRPIFNLRAVYGLGAPNQPGFQNGGTNKTVTGTWSVVNRSESNREASDYRLTSDTPRQSLELRSVGDGLLHLVSRDGALMVGNGGYSYTLNSTDARPSRNAAPSFEAVAAALPAAAGVFDGRTPCRQLAGRLGTFRVDDSCMKLKWRLTLHQDSSSGVPTRYVLEGTAYRNTPRTGKWAVMRNRNDPSITIYVLDPDDAERSLSLVRADDNILLFAGDDGSPFVGDHYFSYTLNRVRKKP